MKLVQLETLSSKPDGHGNSYHAMRVTNLISGKVLEFKISADNSTEAAYHLFKNWVNVEAFCTIEKHTMGYRAFRAETKDWKHGGDIGTNIAKHIIDNGGRPSFYEAVKAHCDENGIEISNNYSDLFVPVSPAVTGLLEAYGKDLGRMFQNNITGKPCYDVPFAYLPYWEAKQKSVQATKEYTA